MEKKQYIAPTTELLLLDEGLLNTQISGTNGPTGGEDKGPDARAFGLYDEDDEAFLMEEE